MGWRLCSEFRTSDLIASDGPGDYRILLTSPDADHADAVVEWMQTLGAALAALGPGEEPLAFEVDLEPERASPARGRCELHDRGRLDTPISTPAVPDAEAPLGPDEG